MLLHCEIDERNSAFTPLYVLLAALTCAALWLAALTCAALWWGAENVWPSAPEETAPAASAPVVPPEVVGTITATDAMACLHLQRRFMATLPDLAQEISDNRKWLKLMAEQHCAQFCRRAFPPGEHVTMMLVPEGNYTCLCDNSPSALEGPGGNFRALLMWELYGYN